MRKLGFKLPERFTITNEIREKDKRFKHVYETHWSSGVVNLLFINSDISDLQSMMANQKVLKNVEGQIANLDKIERVYKLR